MNPCPCCSTQMLRHIRSHQVHWFCRHCWHEMPNLDNVQRRYYGSVASSQLSSPLPVKGFSLREN